MEEIQGLRASGVSVSALKCVATCERVCPSVWICVSLYILYNREAAYPA